MSKNNTKMSQPLNILEQMKQLLASMDINDYEPAVPHMLVELFYRHVTEVLREAQRSCDYKKSKETSLIGEDDLRFAINIVLQQSSLHTQPLEQMQNIAKKINEQPLPSIPDIPEFILPNEETSLLEPNDQIGSQNTT